jgi:two-component system phosphate regulon sensor histidine kinase PhoR
MATEEAGDDLRRIAALIREHRVELLSNWRVQVRELFSARSLDTPTLTDHLPVLLDELAIAFETSSDRKIERAIQLGSSPAHGSQRVQDGFNIAEVVAEYNILRGCIYDLVVGAGLRLEGRAFHILSHVLDSAIGLAVDTYATAQALEVQHRREEYLAFVAHDLRTPLSAISLTTRVIEQAPDSPAGAAIRADMIQRLRRNIYKLEALVAKVLEENSNLETEVGAKLERRRFELWPLVESLIHDLHPVAGTASTTLINGVPGDLVVFADAAMLSRIFQNLIANAITYTPRGEIFIGAKVDPTGTMTECWVQDNGAGIPDELLSTIFEKGAGDPSKPGSTGLGLAIVKTFVEAHGGTVVADRHPGDGTTIRFTLPLLAPDASHGS